MFVRILQLGLVACLLVGCNQLKVRDHIYAGKPLWEEKPYLIKGTNEMHTLTPTIVERAPGLANLIHQVFGIKKENKLKVSEIFSDSKVVEDNAPIPSELATSAVMKVVVGTLAQAVYSTDSSTVALATQIKALTPTKLSADDFSRFRDSLVKMFNANIAVDAISNLSPSDLIPKNLLERYLTAYYKGEYIDRIGSTLAKPKIGTTISNETISNLTHILLDVIVDYVILSAPAIKAPIVYKKVDSKNVYFNVTKKAPTFAKVLIEIDNSKDAWKRVLEEVKPNDAACQGISEEELEKIQRVAGIAGDNAQILSGWIVRLFGGANLGVVIMGKISIGDNETLARLADTVAEVLMRRATEFIVATGEY